MKSTEFDAKELEVYEKLAHFVVYHEFMAQYDGLVERALQGKRYSSDVKFYYEYRKPIVFRCIIRPGARG